MKTIVTILHIIVSLGLIGAVLLHSGRGTGLSNAFGGGMPSSMGSSTMIEKNLDRLTVIFAVIFLFTSIYLAKTSGIF
jgi:preprotein translocase subunit SecG